jgi:hypothetical protein
MNIDSATGALNLPELGLSIFHTLARQEFLKSQAFSQSRPGVQNPPWRTYSLPQIPLADSILHINILFNGEHLDSLSLAHSAEPFGLSWGDWSKEKELARKNFHETWLNQIYAPVGRYPWGKIESLYDDRGGSSSILIRYE